MASCGLASVPTTPLVTVEKLRNCAVVTELVVWLLTE